jgi:hypothetical protein
VFLLLDGVRSCGMSLHVELADLYLSAMEKISTKRNEMHIDFQPTDRLNLALAAVTIVSSSPQKAGFPGRQRASFENLPPRPPDPIAAAALDSAHHAMPIRQQLDRLRLLIP